VGLPWDVGRMGVVLGYLWWAYGGGWWLETSCVAVVGCLHRTKSAVGERCV